MLHPNPSNLCSMSSNVKMLYKTVFLSVVTEFKTAKWQF